MYKLKSLWGILVYVFFAFLQIISIYFVFKSVSFQFIYDSEFKEYFDTFYLWWDPLTSPQVYTYSYDPAFHNATIRLNEVFPFKARHGGMIRQAGWAFRDFACTVPLS